MNWRRVGKSIGNKFSRNKNPRPKPRPQPQQPQPQQSPGYAPIGVGGGGIGGGWIKWVIIGLLLAGAGIGGFFLFVYISGATGAGQAASGPMFQVQQGINNFVSSFGFRSMWWQITHPFEIQPQQAKTEQTNSKYQFLKSLRESFSVRVDVAPPQLQYGQEGMARIIIQNLGTLDMKKYYIVVLPAPGNEIINCLGPSIGKVKISPNLDNGPDINCSHTTGPLSKYLYDSDICGEFKNEYTQNKAYFSVFESNNPITPGESKVFTLSNLYVNTSCGGGKKVNVPQAYPFFVKVITPYVAASRIPVTFISKDYQSLLFTQGLYKQYKVPATAMAGTAVQINIDAGIQPLSSDTNLLPIIFNFQNKGEGKILGNPMMFLVIPGDFGNCTTENYYTCDGKLNASDYCGKGKLNETLGSFAAKELNWICDRINNPGNYHICVANPKQEFRAYSCTLKPHIHMNKDQRRETYYITAFAVYDYESKSYGTLNAYTLGT